MKRNKFLKYGAYLSLAGLIASCSSLNELRDIADDQGFSPKTAYEAWSELNYSATSFNARALLVDGQSMSGFTSGITWGAEKEASSFLITRVMGPPASDFKQKVSALSEDDRAAFLKEFIEGYRKDANGFRTFRGDDGLKVDLATDVVDIEGVNKTIDLSELKALDLENASLEQMQTAFNNWLEQTDDNPFSFLNSKVKNKLFKGNMAGLPDKFFNDRVQRGYSGYGTWKPLFGKAQKYLDSAHAHGGGQGGGWEMNFRPLDTYGEFEEMVSWFKNELRLNHRDPRTGSPVKLFQAPGHQRMVFKAHPDLPETQLSELYRMIQSYIVLKGIAGKTGIEFANYKSIHDDNTISNVNPSSWHNRGVIRIEGPRWGQGTHGIEFRAGTKDLNVARFYQTVLAARVSSNDFGGMANIGDYNLYTSDLIRATAVAQRLDMPEAEVRAAKDKMYEAGIKDSYQIQFWNWTDDSVPFMQKDKKALVKSLTRDFVRAVNQIPDNDPNIKEKIRTLNQDWVHNTRIIQSVERYMQPRADFVAERQSIEFEAPDGRARVANPVNVNEIDLGIEYSGKFPLMVRGDFSEERLGDGKKAWIQTRSDLTEEERKKIIKNVAESLKTNLGGTAEVSEIDADGHGHGLDVAYELRDSQNRKWIVEWDGIGRSYTPDGEIIEGSARGGSIELVTPKFVPQIEEINEVYKAFEANDILPNLESGGGHVNIDLAAFDGKPKELARFLSIFHEHRGVISLMFQHVNRVRTSEPAKVSQTLSNKLKNFNGSEEELKKLLYNEQYFNPRFGRKTRYIQIDMSAYFQDVIPEEFVTDDFDIANPTIPWRRQFRVDPNIRKMEFRMFNAPRDAMESALQVKLVRAMLDKALNSTESLSGSVQKVDHLNYRDNPELAQDHLKKMCDDLGLNIDEFRPSVSEGLAETEKASRSIFFETLEQKLANNPPQRGWGQAIQNPRSDDNALNSADREWTRGPADELNTVSNERRIEAAREGQRRRNNIVPAREAPGQFVRTENCADLLSGVL